MRILIPLYHVFHETQMAMAMAVVITKVATRAGAVVYAVKVRSVIQRSLTFLLPIISLAYCSFLLFMFSLTLCHR